MPKSPQREMSAASAPSRGPMIRVVLDPNVVVSGLTQPKGEFGSEWCYVLCVLQARLVLRATRVRSFGRQQIRGIGLLKLPLAP